MPCKLRRASEKRRQSASLYSQEDVLIERVLTYIILAVCKVDSNRRRWSLLLLCGLLLLAGVLLGAGWRPGIA